MQQRATGDFAMPHDLSLTVAEALLQTERPRGHRPAPGTGASRHAVIAVSREVGALGETVAREVGDRLGCPVYGREIVDKVAEELRQPASALHRLDERPTFWIEDWMSGMPGQEKLVGMDTYVKYLFATMRGLAQVGRCVIVGRGAAHILPPEHTLRVRLIAYRRDRIKNVQRLRHLDAQAAEEWLERTEHERTLYMRRNFNIDPAEPHLHDVLLNTSRLSVADCADVIVHAFAQFECLVTAPAAR
jgi:cytidylate kinase